MRILFDQGTPVPLRRSLHPHTVDTASEMGWATLTNGELIAAAEEAGFDAMITLRQVNQWGHSFEEFFPGSRLPASVIASSMIIGLDLSIIWQVIQVDLPTLQKHL